MRFHASITLVLTFCFAFTCTLSQEEAGMNSQPSVSWTMLSVHRVWTPQYNGYPNGGFGVQTFFGMGHNRNPWFGFSIIGTGLERRDALAINFGFGTWFLGDSRLGAYGFAMSGLGMSSSSGLTGFNFFSDRTLVYGLASQAGVGGAAEVFTNIKVHLTLYGLWFTTDGGPTPVGLQLGMTFGGK